jgi:hypothetical protein
VAAATAAILAMLAGAAGPAMAGDEGTGRGGGAAGESARQARAPEIAGLAEYHLSTLAASSRRARHLGSGLGLAAGAVFLVGGLSILHDAEEEYADENWNPLPAFEAFGGAMMVAMGSAGLAGGIVSLAAPSTAESRYARVRAIADPGLREEASAEALRGLARRGKRSRTVRAALFGGLGLVATLSASGSDDQGSNWAAAGCGAGLAALSLLTTSRAERTYRAYLEKKGLGISPELILSAGPRGGFRAGVSIDF